VIAPDALPRRPFLYPIVDVDIVGERAIDVVVRLARAGVPWLQLRAKDVSDRRLLVLARDAVSAAHEGGARLIVNDRPDVARMVAADGVHLGQDDLPPSDARALLGPAAIIGVSTHSLDQLEAARHEPVDYIAVGPIFATTSKKRPDPVVGPALVARARALLGSLPLVAIGGITRRNVREVVVAGADGVAVIGDLLRAPDLEAALRELTAVLG
jgi:thiamine-phosphate pyrophosphorylase